MVCAPASLRARRAGCRCCDSPSPRCSRCDGSRLRPLRPPPEPTGPHPRMLLDAQLRTAWKAQAQGRARPGRRRDHAVRATRAHRHEHDSALYQGSEWAKALQACLVAWAATGEASATRRPRSGSSPRCSTISISSATSRAATRAARARRRLCDPHARPVHRARLRLAPRSDDPGAARPRPPALGGVARLVPREGLSRRATRARTTRPAICSPRRLIAIAQAGEAPTAGAVDAGRRQDVGQGHGRRVRRRRRPRRRRLARGLAVRPAVGRRVRARARGSPRAPASASPASTPGSPACCAATSTPCRPATACSPAATPRTRSRTSTPNAAHARRDRARRCAPRRPALGARRAVAAQASPIDGLAALRRARRRRRPAGARAARDLADLVRPPNTGTLFARTRWDDRAIWFVASVPHGLDVDHRHPDAGNFVLSRGKDDVIVDPSPYGTPVDADRQRADHRVGPHFRATTSPSQGVWSTATAWDWTTQTRSGVVAVRCDYADQLQVPGPASDVPEALRDLVLLPSATARDAALVVVDRARTGGGERAMYLRFRVRGELALDGDSRPRRVGATKLAIATVARSAGQPCARRTRRARTASRKARAAAAATRRASRSPTTASSSPAPSPARST